MKKTLVIMIAVLLILSALVSGTMAVYTTTDEITSGSITAKQMILCLTKGQGFDEAIALAPTESVEYSFSVSNTKDSNTTQLPFDATIVIQVIGAEGKTAIGNLTAEVLCDGVSLGYINMVEGIGSMTITNAFGTTAQAYEYIVILNWPSSDNDIDYCGSEFGSVINVTATAVQSADATQPDDPEPTEPNEPDEPIDHRILQDKVCEDIVADIDNLLPFDGDFCILYRSDVARKIYYSYSSSGNIKPIGNRLKNFLRGYLVKLGENEKLYVDVNQSCSGILNLTVTYYSNQGVQTKTQTIIR